VVLDQKLGVVFLEGESYLLKRFDLTIGR